MGEDTCHGNQFLLLPGPEALSVSDSSSEKQAVCQFAIHISNLTVNIINTSSYEVLADVGCSSDFHILIVIWAYTPT